MKTRFISEGFIWESDHAVPAHNEAAVSLGDVQLALDAEDGSYQLVGATADGMRYGLAVHLSMDAVHTLLQARRRYLLRYQPDPAERHRVLVFPKSAPIESIEVRQGEWVNPRST